VLCPRPLRVKAQQILDCGSFGMELSQIEGVPSLDTVIFEKISKEKGALVMILILEK